MKKITFLMLGMAAALALPYTEVRAQEEIRDSVKIYFRQDYSTLDMSIRDNRAVLDSITDKLSSDYADSVYRIEKILVVGGASPEGTIRHNRNLSANRAKRLFDYLGRYGELPDSLTTFHFLGRDWHGLVRLVEADDNVPYKQETLRFLYDILRRLDGGEKVADNNVGRLSRLRGGRPYKYMYRVLFPELRASRLHLWYQKMWNPVKFIPLVLRDSITLPPAGPLAPVPAPLPDKPFYMAVKTNMIYDALLVPNVGVEFYLGDGFSIAADWMYGWWKKDRAHWYWRTYGGDVVFRKWLGRAAAGKPLTGHHLGVYAQVQTFDFEMGGRGYMGGEPGGDIFDRALFGGGLEYGYALPVARRLNLDFSAAVGYFGGKYYEYLPMDDCYVWQATKKLRYFGPTKLEVSLVWLIGHGNYNKQKGGRK